MRRLVTTALVGAAAMLPQSVNAATYILSFTNGVANATPTAPTTVVGNGYSDTYLFTTVADGTFSGTFSTQRLRVPSTGPIVSDLDFVSASLDNVDPFSITPTGLDGYEQIRIGSTDLAAGDHSVVLNYNVTAASAANGASYSGTLNFGASSAVPEPAAWAMFIIGFGAIGAGMRKRRHTLGSARF